MSLKLIFKDSRGFPIAAEYSEITDSFVTTHKCKSYIARYNFNNFFKRYEISLNIRLTTNKKKTFKISCIAQKFMTSEANNFCLREIFKTHCENILGISSFVNLEQTDKDRPSYSFTIKDATDYALFIFHFNDLIEKS